MDELKGLSETIKETKEALPDTVNQTDGVLSTVVGFFNHVVLYPIKKANISFRYKLEDFERDLQQKISQIPEENLQEPPVMIAGPTLEALRYTYDEYELREMYENLLVAAMDSRNVQKAHPSYVDIIKQLSPFDAIVLKSVFPKGQMLCADIDFKIKDTEKIYAVAMPSVFAPDLLFLGDPFQISVSIENLRRLGLLSIIDNAIVGADYSYLKEIDYVKERKELYEGYGEEITIVITPQALRISDYGKTFGTICLSKEE